MGLSHQTRRSFRKLKWKLRSQLAATESLPFLPPVTLFTISTFCEVFGFWILDSLSVSPASLSLQTPANPPSHTLAHNKVSGDANAGIAHRPAQQLDKITSKKQD